MRGQVDRAHRRAEGKFLLEKENYFIFKSQDGLVDLTRCGPRTKRDTALAWEYKVNSVSLDTLEFGNRKTAKWLLDLPPLRRLSLSLWVPVDLTAIERLATLRELRIDFTIWRVGDQFPPVDLSSLRQLQYADVMMCQPVESILQCEPIRELVVRNECDGRLRDVDLTRLQSLRDLSLKHCPRLRSVRLHPKAKLRGLELSLCGSYQIDWKRVGPDLEYLSLGGRLTFPLKQILNAPRLKELHTAEIRKLPSLGFLRKLRHLKVVQMFSAPPGPKLSKNDEALVRRINARGRTRS
jgi:hypothetical protein